MAGFELRPSGLVKLQRDEVELSVAKRRSGSGATVELRVVADHEGLASVPQDSPVVLVLDHNYFRQEPLDFGTWRQLLTGATAVASEKAAGRLAARLLVTSPDPSEHRKLLVTAELQVDLGDMGTGTVSLLLAEYDENLGQTPFWLETDPQPKLRLNARFRDVAGFEDSEMFQGLVYPEVVRRIAEWLLTDECDLAEEVPSRWKRVLTAGPGDGLARRLDDLRSSELEASFEARRSWVFDVCRQVAQRQAPVGRILAERRDG